MPNFFIKDLDGLTRSANTAFYSQGGGFDWKTYLDDALENECISLSKEDYESLCENIKICYHWAVGDACRKLAIFLIAEQINYFVFGWRMSNRYREEKKDNK